MAPDAWLRPGMTAGLLLVLGCSTQVQIRERDTVGDGVDGAVPTPAEAGAGAQGALGNAGAFGGEPSPSASAAGGSDGSGTSGEGGAGLTPEPDAGTEGDAGTGADGATGDGLLVGEDVCNALCHCIGKTTRSGELLPSCCFADCRHEPGVTNLSPSPGCGVVFEGTCMERLSCSDYPGCDFCRPDMPYCPFMPQ